MADNTIKITLEAEDKASKVVESLSKTTQNETKKLAQALDSLNKQQEAQAKKVEDAWKTVNKSMAIVGGVATGALAGAAKAAIDYETAMAGVNKTMTITPEQLDRLGDSFKKMSTEIPVSASELANIAEIGGQLGVGINDIEKFTETISKMSSTTNLSSEEAAIAFARISNVMGDNLQDVDKLASAIVELGNNFAVNEKEIVNFATRLAPVGSALGMTSDQILGLGAATAAAGIKAEAGSTAMQTTFLLMQQAASGASGEVINNTKKIESGSKKLGDYDISLKKVNNSLKELKDSGKENSARYQNLLLDQQKITSQTSALNGELEVLNATNGKLVPSANGFAKILGITNKEFEKTFKENPAGVYVDLIKKMAEAKDKGEDFVGMLEDAGIENARAVMTTLAQVGAQEQLVSAMDASAKAYQENIALDIEFNKKKETTAAQLKILKDNINVAAITLGDAMLPAINKIVKALIPFIQGFADFAEKHPNVVIGILGIVSALGGLSALIITLGPSISAIVTILQGMGVTVVGVKIALMGFLGILSTIASVIAPVVAIAGLLLLAIDDLFYRLGLTEERFQFIKEFFGALGEAWDLFKGKVGELSEKLFGVKDATEQVQNAEQNLADARNAKIDAELRMLQSIKDVEDARDKVREATEKLMEVEKQHGKDSPEYVEAQQAKRIEQLKLQGKINDSTEAIDEFNSAEQENIDLKDQQIAALKEVGEEAKFQEGNWFTLAETIWNAARAIWDFVRGSSEAKGFEGGNKSGGQFEHGGIVPGPVGAPIPILAHGGERVVSRTGTDTQSGTGSPAASGGISISFNGPVNMDSTDRVDQLASMIEARLSRNNEMAKYGLALNP